MLIYMMMLETPEEKSLFEQIYLEYRGLMFHVAYEILHNEQDAEDAVHQAFVKIAENIKKIDAPVCPKTHSYVVTIVEHQAIDQYRRLQKHPSVELIEEIQGTNAHYEGDNDLTKCILKLPARYREMILLRYHHGYTVREIAKVLGLSLPTAIKLDQRAKSRLKKMAKNNITFLEDLTEEQLLNEYQNCRAFVFMAEEDFGMVMAEAQAMGKPVIAYEKGGASEIIINDKTGILFKEQNKDSLKDAVLKMEKEYKKFDSVEAREHAQKFNEENFKKELKEFIEEKLKEGK